MKSVRLQAPGIAQPVLRQPRLPRLLARAAVGACLVAAAGLAPLAAAAREASAIIGQVTMSIGAGKLVALDGSSTPVSQGMQVRVGDRVETEANGNVMLRFVDGQLVTVRPLSRLAVENYEQTAIKFRLEEGVVRSVTGKWGEAARDRFRLNTPVAAIGIKGTDFVVKADTGNGASFVTVSTGAVVMSELTEACQASLGVCRTGNEKLLSAEMKGQMLEISRLQTSPRLVPAVDLLSANYRPAVEVAMKSERGGLSGDAARADFSASDKSTLSESRGATVATTTLTTVSPPVVKPPEVSQLVWARGPFTATAIDGDAFSKSFEAAAANGRQVTVVNDGAYYLFRQTPAGQTAALQTNDTSANFRLASGAATLYITNLVRYEAANINGGSLNVDFARNSFSTQLNVSSASMGAEVISVNGGVNSAQSLFSGSSGISGSTGFTTVNGALSTDGKEAGYLFSKQVSLGTLNGYTLWGR